MDASAPRRRIADQAWLLMMLPALFWAGNAVVGRAAVAADVPPVGLAFWRWTMGALIILPFAWPHARRDWPALRQHWRIVVLLAFLGISVFNTLLYLGLQTTSAINGVMLQTLMPVLIVLMNLAVFGESVSLRQTAGIAVSLAGAVTLIAHGRLETLLGLHFAIGDLFVLAAVVCYAGYTMLLRRRPAVHGLSFVVATFVLGAAMLLPFYLIELGSGRRMPFTLTAALALGYVGLFPSILAYLAFNRAVALVGANTAGLAIHLVPVFGSVLAILFLGETLHLYHAAGIGLIFSGIALASRRSKDQPHRNSG